jgi:hypothetical protein
MTGSKIERTLIKISSEQRIKIESYQNADCSTHQPTNNMKSYKTLILKCQYNMNNIKAMKIVTWIYSIRIIKFTFS